jgi:hypothetical protein
LNSGDFLGEGCLAAQPLRMATASTISDCSIVRLEKAAMILRASRHGRRTRAGARRRGAAAPRRASGFTASPGRRVSAEIRVVRRRRCVARVPSGSTSRGGAAAARVLRAAIVDLRARGSPRSAAVFQAPTTLYPNAQAPETRAPPRRRAIGR